MSTQWEYLVHQYVYQSGDVLKQGLQADLDMLGKDGWELISMPEYRRYVPDNSASSGVTDELSVTLVFKKPRSS